METYTEKYRLSTNATQMESPRGLFPKMNTDKIEEIKLAIAAAVEAGSLTPDSGVSESEDPEVPALLVNLGEWREESSRGDAAQKIVDHFGLAEWASGHGEFGPITVYQLN